MGELKAKISELMNECKKKGLNIASISERVGLSRFLKCRSCFQRLYDDAMERVARLDMLREKYTAAKQAQNGVARDSPDAFQIAPCGVQRSTIAELLAIARDQDQGVPEQELQSEQRHASSTDQPAVMEVWGSVFGSGIPKEKTPLGHMQHTRSLPMLSPSGRGKAACPLFINSVSQASGRSVGWR